MAVSRRLGAVLLVLAVLTLGALVSEAGASDTPRQTAFEANGTVHAVARGGGLTFIGGEFTELRLPQPNFATIGTVSGRANGAIPDANGTIHATIPDGAGGFYIGGEFTKLGGFTRNRIAHVKADGQLDPMFNPDADGPVRALALAGDELFVGGQFSNIGGLPRGNLAKLSATSGNAFSAWDPDADDPVLSLAVSGSTLYVGGSFTDVDGIGRNGIAKVSTTSGNVFTTWNPNATFGAGGGVFAIEPADGLVYVGGRFTGIGGQARNNLAKLSATSGNAFSAWDPDGSGGPRPIDGDVLSLIADDGVVYAGGRFTQIGNAVTGFAAKLSATSGNAFQSFFAGGNNTVASMALSGGSLYVGGFFESIGGQVRRRLARLSTASGNASSSFNPNVGGTGTGVRSIALSGTTLAAGGNFPDVAGQARLNYAQFTVP